MPYTVPEARVRECPFSNNLLVNPGFEIWQRGNGPFTANGFVCDEWSINTIAAGDTISISRSTNSHSGLYCPGMTFTKSTGGTGLMQGIEAWKSLEGQTITFSAWVWSNAVNGCRIQVEDYNGVGTEGTISSLHPGDSAWHLLTAIKTIRTGLTTYGIWAHSYGVRVGIVLLQGSGSVFRIDEAVLATGYFPEGLLYVPGQGAKDMLRCERYYQAHTGSLHSCMWSGQCTSGFGYYTDVTFSTPMSAVPTLTLTNQANAGFPATPSTSYAATRGFWAYRVANGTVNGYYSDDWKAEIT